MSILHGLPLLLAFGIAACAAGPATTPLRLVPGDRRPVLIESTTIAADGRSAEVRVSSTRGIFALDLDLSGEAGARLDRLVLVVGGERFCEGLEAEVVDASGRETTVELRGHAGVSVTPRGVDLEIALGPDALAALRPRARLQFVNQWR